MTIICRTLRIAAAESTGLTNGAMSLTDAIASSRNYSDVYRYWDGISFLLKKHSPSSVAARWRQLGTEVAASVNELPATQHILPDDVRALAAELSALEPEALAPHYAAASLDADSVYPSCWARWEETFDPLGQLLEHYHFLRQTSLSASQAGDAMLLVYEDDGDEPFYEDN